MSHVGQPEATPYAYAPKKLKASLSFRLHVLERNAFMRHQNGTTPMPTRLKPCPFDASRKLKVEHFNGDYHVQCQGCGATGPLAATWAEAEDRWNDRKGGGTDKH